MQATANQASAIIKQIIDKNLIEVKKLIQSTDSLRGLIHDMHDEDETKIELIKQIISQSESINNMINYTNELIEVNKNQVKNT